MDNCGTELTFKDVDEGWATARLGDVVSFKVTNSFSREYLNYEHGRVKNIHYGDIHTKFQTLFDIEKEYVPFINPDKEINKIKDESYCEEGDLILADASEDLDDIGKSIEIVNLNNEKLVSGLHTILARPDKGLFPKGFIGYLFQSGFIRNQIQKESQGAKVLGISAKRLQNLIIHYPLSTLHSTKIASCLSSLDEVIAANTQKLDLLKEHKKGLMQNLFPQEGEKVPKYRFKEFEKDGEWELKPFSKYIKLYRGSSPRPIIEYQTQDLNGVNWIKIGDTGSITDYVIRSVSEKITPKGAEKSRAVQKGELILANSMSYGSTYLLDIEGCIYDGWFVLREYDEVFDKQFLLQLLNSEYMQNQYKKLAAGGIVQNISSEIVYSTLVPKTSKPEQQKIASCLSSLDALITALAEKIEQLKLHKKGLMQGLFPKIITPNLG
jgi:type I restriction enzyme, S subunit